MIFNAPVLCWKFRPFADTKRRGVRIPNRTPEATTVLLCSFSNYSHSDARKNNIR